MKRAIFLAVLCIPGTVAAQTTTTVSSYVAADAGVAGNPVMLGVSVSRETGWMAARVGGGLDVVSAFGGPPEPGTSDIGVLSGDVDALVYWGGARSTSSLVPYAVVGAGGRLLTGAGTGSGLNWGYGVGARMPLLDRFSLEGEIRYREPVGASDAVSGQSAGLELRAGMSLSFGRSLPRPRVPTPSAPPPVRRPNPLPPVATGSGSSEAARRAVAERTLSTANNYLGVRYTWGGNTPNEGFDCSGFVRYVFAQNGISLPRVSADQARAGTQLPLSIGALEPGDLLAFASDGFRVDHIAIYAGNGRILHSSASGRGVRYDDLYSQRGNWYRTHMVAARRVIDAPFYFSAE
jgi:hypothetical protein